MYKLFFPAVALLLAACSSPRSSSDAISVIPEPLSVRVMADSVQVNSYNLAYTVNSDEITHPEGYRLTATPGGVVIVGGSDAGVFYAFRTLSQLMDEEGNMPCVEIRDEPRFSWRGMHLDVARHFQPAEYIKRYLDILAFHKINTFHWHLTDGIGWRIEIDRYPLLTEKGAWRKVKDERAPWIGFETSREGAPDSYGGYYTKEEIRDIVAYAAARHITVVPEIEMPGHSEAVTCCYPEYICEGAGPGSGIFCPGREETFGFLENILDEVMDLFPGPYIHIGGDEVGKGQWAACPLCRQRKAQEGLQSEEELQSYFVRRIEHYISSKGKRMIGWDEILEGGLADGAVVMSWTGFEGGLAAANSGHDVVMCPLDYVYFDHYQAQNPCEPQAWGGNNTLERVYSFEPVPEGVAPDKAHHILGGQGNIWTENIRIPSHIEYMLLPRLAALSEVLWSAPSRRDWSRFQQKADRMLDWYAALGWNYSESAFTPFIKAQELHPDGTLTLKLATGMGDYPIHYTLDGTEPTTESPIHNSILTLTGPADLCARTFRRGMEAGCELFVPALLNPATGKSISYTIPYNDSYSGGGAGALTDNRYADKRGDDPRWQGFEGTDMELTLDLGEVRAVKTLSVRFFQHIGSTSVLLPIGFTVRTSQDGEIFTDPLQIAVPASVNPDAFIETVTAEFPAAHEARYLRIRAENIGVLPAGHPRAGGAAWIFADEIAVR